MKKLVVLALALLSLSAHAGLFLSEGQEPAPEDFDPLGLFLSE